MPVLAEATDGAWQIEFVEDADGRGSSSCGILDVSTKCLVATY